MSKIFTDIPLHQFDQVKVESLIKNTDKYLSEYNGRLDSNNLPVASVGPDNLVTPSLPPGVTQSVGALKRFSSKMPTQAYYASQINSNTLSGDIWTPNITVDLDVDTWSKGFNTLPLLNSAWDNYALSFEATEGMLIGCGTIDWEHGNQVFQVDDGLGNFVPRGRGFEWWTEIAIFVNNVLVARSGEIYPRRHTTQLPFTIPCGSQSIQIDMRIRINTWRAAGSPSLQVTSSPFYIWSTDLWCRNCYR